MMQQLFHSPFQPWQVEWFGEEILRLHGDRAFGDAGGQRAHENDGDFLGSRLAFQDFADRNPVQIRQKYI